MNAVKRHFSVHLFDYIAVASFFALHALVFSLWPVGGYGYDSGQYLKMMEFGRFSDLHPNGYSMLLAFVRLFSDSPCAPYCFNHLMSFGTDVVLYFLARQVWSRPWSVLLVLAYSFCTRALVWDEWLLSESAFLFLLAVQIWLLRDRGGVRKLSTWSSIFLGLVMGLSFLVRMAELFLVPVLLFPVGFNRPKRFNFRKYLKNAGLAAGVALVVVAPDVVVHKLELGSFSMTQSLPWNLFIGHADTARCKPDPSQPEVMNTFCAAFSGRHAHLREFPLAFYPDSPGAALVQRYGSFKEAGPALMAIMVHQIQKKPWTFFSDAMFNLEALFTRDDGWYLPGGRGQFVKDPDVTAAFAGAFGGSSSELPDRSNLSLLLTDFRVPRIVIVGLWLVGLALLVYRRRVPHFLNGLVVLSICGTIFVTLGEPRYLAPVELTIACLVPLEMSRFRRGKVGSN